MAKSDPGRRDASPGVIWEGPFFAPGSLAYVNRHLCAELYAQGGLALELIPTARDAFAPTTAAERELRTRYRAGIGFVGAHVCHQYSPDLDPPREGRWIFYQPPEHGYVPADWAGVIDLLVDDIWVNSSYSRTVLVESGVNSERVFKFPLGVDPTVFFPAGVSPDLSGDGVATRFLFVGSSTYKKGVDALLQAYLRTFGRQDPVELVILDDVEEGRYAGNSQVQALTALAQRPDIARIVYRADR
ncbi:MAG: hypothetical protein OWT27_05705, partial [Firmicutes bacterium]|nr:hypothetical protein [Bacillota bacterium]